MRREEGDVQRAVSLALEGTVRLEEAEREARALCLSLDADVTRKRNLTETRDAATMGVEMVFHALRLASSQVEASLWFIHQVFEEPGASCSAETRTLLEISLRSFAAQRRANELLGAALHALRTLPTEGRDAAVGGCPAVPRPVP